MDQTLATSTAEVFLYRDDQLYLDFGAEEFCWVHVFDFESRVHIWKSVRTIKSPTRNLTCTEFQSCPIEI